MKRNDRSTEERSEALEILPTRVRRNYTGGALLESWAEGAIGRDGNQPEDWMASTTDARNPGQPPVAREGVTRLRLPDGRESDLRAEIVRDPEHYLGCGLARSVGVGIGFLAKLLDSAIRLHVQAHPTAEFAQRHLGSAHGKLETYVILGVRAGCDPCIWLGFKDAPARGEWRRIIVEQDLAAMHARLNRLAVAPGEVWLVPGGWPHAIGEGVLMLEVMEPSDLVVRCEFERAGMVVPEAARYMGRDLDLCLDVFDYQTRSTDEVRANSRLVPRIVRQTGGCADEELVGRAHTACFSVRRLRATARARLPEAGRFRALLVTAGTGRLVTATRSMELRRGVRWVVPAATEDCWLEPTCGAQIEVLVCISGESRAQPMRNKMVDDHGREWLSIGVI